PLFDERHLPAHRGRILRDEMARGTFRSLGREEWPVPTDLLVPSGVRRGRGNPAAPLLRETLHARQRDRSRARGDRRRLLRSRGQPSGGTRTDGPPRWLRSEEHTSELQSRFDLVCRLLLEKKKNKINRLNKSHRQGL